MKTKIDKNLLKESALVGITQNPVFVLVLGMCPLIAVSTSLVNALGMGAATLIVLTLSNTLISLCRRIIPDRVRLPAYILIIATLVTLIDLFLRRFMPPLSASLGVFIPLITVNCIIFARAESFASISKPLYAAVDGLSMGIGFTLAISLLGSLRELLAYGSIVFSQPAEDVIAASRNTLMPIFITPVGGFLVLAFLLAIFNAVYKRVRKEATA